jgi:hypothetical protein
LAKKAELFNVNNYGLIAALTIFKLIRAHTKEVNIFNKIYIVFFCIIRNDLCDKEQRDISKA